MKALFKEQERACVASRCSRQHLISFSMIVGVLVTGSWQ